LRAKAHPTVSTPVSWKEVTEAKKKGNSVLLTFDSKEVLKRIKSRGDLFEPVLNLKQKLPKFSTPPTKPQ
jgi:bifunctional non-homologous end joining protein LigD